MADYKVLNNKLPAAAAASLPVSKDRGEVSPPLPDMDDDVKQIKPHRPLLAAMLVDVTPASSPLSSISPQPVAVIMPGADNNSKTTTTPPAAVRMLLIVCPWALLNACAFAAAGIATLIVNRTPCTKSTWLFRCVALTDAAATELNALLNGVLWCSVAAALAAPLHMLLNTRTTTTSRMRGRWAAAVDALAWVALAATAGIHYMEVASDSICLSADPGDTYIFADFVFGSVCLAVDLRAGVLLCCSPRRLKMGEQQGEDALHALGSAELAS